MKLRFSLDGYSSLGGGADNDNHINFSCATSDFEVLKTFIAQTDFFSSCKEPDLRLTVPKESVKDFLHLWQKLIDSKEV